MRNDRKCETAKLNASSLLKNSFIFYAFKLVQIHAN